MSEIAHNCAGSSAHQTLDELDFERGIWYAAQYNDIPRVKELLNKGVDINVEDKSGYTALHYASRNGHLEMCKMLISMGANVNALTKSGKVSSLHRCVSAGHFDIFKLLLQNGASVNLKDADGKNVLHRAVEGRHVNFVDEILKLDPLLAKETDNRGKLPKDYVNESQEIKEIFNSISESECKS